MERNFPIILPPCYSTLPHVTLVNHLKAELYLMSLLLDFPGSTIGKESAANAGDARDIGSIPASGRSPGGENGNQLHCSRLDNSMNRGGWRPTVTHSSILGLEKSMDRGALQGSSWGCKEPGMSELLSTSTQLEVKLLVRRVFSSSAAPA